MTLHHLGPPVPQGLDALSRLSDWERRILGGPIDCFHTCRERGVPSGMTLC
jgi:hypothetical protein